MRDSPDMAGDTHAASLVRRNVNLPCMAGNMIGIADAVCDTPVVTGDAFAASLTQRTVDLPYMAGSIKSIADAMRDSPDWKVNIRSVTHTTYG